METEKTGRNDPCPCGSGKKYKQCCMGKQQQAAKYTPSGKRKFKATLIKTEAQAGTLFEQSGAGAVTEPTSDIRPWNRFRKTTEDFRVSLTKEQETEWFFEAPIGDPQPQRGQGEKLPPEHFVPTQKDFRQPLL